MSKMVYHFDLPEKIGEKWHLPPLGKTRKRTSFRAWCCHQFCFGKFPMLYEDRYFRKIFLPLIFLLTIWPSFEGGKARMGFNFLKFSTVRDNLMSISQLYYILSTIFNLLSNSRSSSTPFLRRMNFHIFFFVFFLKEIQTLFCPLPFCDL